MDTTEAKQSLISLGNALLDFTSSAESAANALKQEREGLEKQLLTLLGNIEELRRRELEALHPANRALQQQIWQIEDAKAALEQALQAERDSANAAQERVGTLKSIFDLLKSNVDSLYESVEATKEWGAAQANAFIDNALANAKATGYMPELDDLNSAIAGARAGLDKEYYATEFDRQRETLVLAGKLDKLKEIVEPQLTEAQKQLKALEDTLENSRQQIDVLRGIDASVLSVSDAIEAFQTALTGGEETARQQLAAAAVDPNVNAIGRSQEVADIDPTNIAASVRWATARSASLEGMIAKGGNLSFQEAELASLQAYLANPTTQNIPGFAAGGMHTGGLRIVGENGPELEATGPSRIWNAQQLGGALGGGNTARLEALVEGLTAEVKRLQGIVVRGVEHQRETAEILDNVTEGGNAMRAEVMA